MAQEQLIVSIGREFGSGGHLIAEMVAERFHLPLLDYNLLQEIAAGKNIDVSHLKKYDELPRRHFFHRSVKGHTSSPEVNIAQMQFDFIREKAAKGDSFVIVGRCAEHVLKGHDALVSLFINGDHDKKRERIMKLYNLNFEDAEALMQTTNRKRKNYHNFFCDTKWGDSRNYELCINASRIGYEETADICETYIRHRFPDLDIE
ncbi:MAG: cytidylate kinase-like family protein [Clostridia bacterium]|nr:cytidylate kinase-like family protein [Clostridia bacterium]